MLDAQSEELHLKLHKKIEAQGAKMSAVDDKIAAVHKDLRDLRNQRVGDHPALRL